MSDLIVTVSAKGIAIIGAVILLVVLIKAAVKISGYFFEDKNSQ